MLMLYLTFSAGLVISLHYCGGNLAALKLFVKASCCCDDEETGEEDDCCKDEIKTVKITDDQNIHKEVLLKIKAIQDIGFFPSQLKYSFLQGKIVSTQISNQQLPRPPDGVCLIPAYKLNHSFLFYS
jgi:hypothetical protein